MVTMSLESELCGGQKKASLWDRVRRANTLSWDLSHETLQPSLDSQAGETKGNH